VKVTNEMVREKLRRYGFSPRHTTDKMVVRAYHDLRIEFCTMPKADGGRYENVPVLPKKRIKEIKSKK
jgi:hypothetical protein